MLGIFAWSFGAICVFGVIVNAIRLLRPNALGARTHATLDLLANLALMAWGALLLMNLGRL